MTKVEFTRRSWIEVDLPEEVVVKGVTVKGEYYSYDDDTPIDGPEHCEYWQYEGDNWIIWVDLDADWNSAHLRATADDGNEWVYDDGIKFEDLAATIEDAVREFNEYYARHPDQ